MALFSMVGGLSMSGSNAEAGGMMAGMGLLAIIIAPIAYAIFGFVGGLLGALFMNIAFKITGGLQIDLEQ